MKVKCREYTGTLVQLDAAECIVQNINGTESYAVAWYDVAIRTTGGAKIYMGRVREDEIQFI